MNKQLEDILDLIVIILVVSSENELTPGGQYMMLHKSLHLSQKV